MQQYIMYALDGTDEEALPRRMSHRVAHFKNARRLKTTGNFISGGAILSDEGKMIGSAMIMQFETKEELQHWLDTEPYIIGNVWQKMDLRLFKIADV
jgi:uncharacterized protein YciI